METKNSPKKLKYLGIALDRKQDTMPCNSVGFPLEHVETVMQSLDIERFPINRKVMFSAHGFESTLPGWAFRKNCPKEAVIAEMAKRGFTAIYRGDADSYECQSPKEHMPLYRLSEYMFDRLAANNIATEVDYIKHYIHQRNPNWDGHGPTGVVGVLFTGGMDSTALVIKNLKEGKIVVPIYNWMNHGTESFRILVATAYSCLKVRVKGKVDTSWLCPLVTGMHIPPDITQRCMFEGFIQQPMNSLSLAYIAPEISSLLDEVQMGIIKGDQSETYTEDMKKLYEGAFALSHLYGENHDRSVTSDSRTTRRPDFTFPILDWDKHKIAAFLAENNAADFAISCEVPLCEYLVFARLDDEEKASLTTDTPVIKSKHHDIGIHVLLADCDRCHSCGRSEHEGRARRFVTVQLAEFNDNPNSNPLIDYNKIAHDVKPNAVHFGGKL